MSRADSNVGLNNSLRQSFGQLLPALPAVSGLKDAPASPIPRTILPWPLPRLPQRGVSHVRVGGINLDISPANVFVLVEDLLEALPAISRPKNAALRVGPIGMPGHSHQQFVRITRINSNLRNLLPVP